MNIERYLQEARDKLNNIVFRMDIKDFAIAAIDIKNGDQTHLEDVGVATEIGAFAATLTSHQGTETTGLGSIMLELKKNGKEFLDCEIPPLSARRLALALLAHAENCEIKPTFKKIV